MEPLATQAVYHSTIAFIQKLAEFITWHSSRVKGEEKKVFSITAFIENFIAETIFHIFVDGKNTMTPENLNVGAS